MADSDIKHRGRTMSAAAPDILELLNDAGTEAGNYFVANYPPFSLWSTEFADRARAAMDRPPASGTVLGLYVHIPFCRKRCHFCYFKVYTDRNSSQIRRYLDAVLLEARYYATRRFVGERKAGFIYFGGGTPSYLSADQLQYLTDGLKELLPWEKAEEITFEAEPGTLTAAKLQKLRAIGVTRLSLGVENFDPQILATNNRAHGERDIYRSYETARAVGFPQVNIDLIAGMVGETAENWQRCVQKTIDLAPECVTIYQMEVPFNTGIYQQMKAEGKVTAPIADWKTKREWVAGAFEQLDRAGYTITSAYTAVRDPRKYKFLYRDMLWTGADLVGLGVASFSHIGGVHFQNEHDIEPYMAALEEGRIPIHRGWIMDAEESMLRELILQMKLGVVRRGYFREKFGVDPMDRFADQFQSLRAAGLMDDLDDTLRLSRRALLQVDRFLPAFYLPQHRAARYA
jgi:oxygen-independent coproporphyrinogen-3 oxidase